MGKVLCVIYEDKTFILNPYEMTEEKIFGIDQAGTRVFFYRNEILIIREGISKND